jgi:hypothetical protein
MRGGVARRPRRSGMVQHANGVAAWRCRAAESAGCNYRQAATLEMQWGIEVCHGVRFKATATATTEAATTPATACRGLGGDC